MQAHTGKQIPDTPDNLIRRVARQLRNHSLWDSLLIFSPPILALLYGVGSLYHSGWISAPGAFATGTVLTVIGLLAVIFRHRRRLLSLPSAARLVDDKARAEDRFVTLATVDPQTSSEVFLARLRQETAGLVDRVRLRRDFPYRPKRSFYGSAAVSLIVAVAVHLFLVGLGSREAGLSVQQLRSLAEQMVQQPPLAELGRGLQALAAKLEEPLAQPQEKQSMIDEMQKRLDEQQKNQPDNTDLLSAAESTLKTLEQQFGAAQQDPQEGGGGVSSNSAQQGQGDFGQDTGSGAAQGEMTAQLNQEMQTGQAGKGDAPAPEPAQREQLGGKPSPADAEKSEKADTKDSGAEGQASQEKGGRSKAEEMPKDGPPAERYYRPGEQAKDGIKGAQYVTVQLPEVIAADGHGGGSGKAGKENRSRPTLPVSNVPLPPHVAEAPAEKQRMPLEYRDLIR